jgi:hypothetical protein
MNPGDLITVSWFSAGVSSAVATKMAIDRIDRIVYQHIDDQHPDTMRFVKECEAWFGKPVEIIQSPLRSVENACRSAAWINGSGGAACTNRLKRQLRKAWEAEHQFFNHWRYVWGMDVDEKNRASDRAAEMWEHEHIFPLIEHSITKAEAHGMLARAGIARPAMYDLGYHNNNCVGCVKGGMGYFNKIRVDFPAVFEARAKMERDIGATCICRDGVRFWLDELDPEAGRKEGPVVPECGVECGSWPAVLKLKTGNLKLLGRGI